MDKHLTAMREAKDKGDDFAVINALNSIEHSHTVGGAELDVLTPEEKAEIQAETARMKAAGYTWDRVKRGDEYDEGMKVIPEFATNDNLAPGEKRIVQVKKPTIIKDGKMVQAADIIVEQSPYDSEEEAEMAARTASAQNSAAEPTGETTGKKPLFEYFKGSMAAFVRAARTAGSNVIKKIIAPVSQSLKDDLTAQGFSIDDGFYHVVDNSGVNHTFKQHGSKKEELRGQIPISESDFELIGDVIDNYDELEVDNSVNPKIIKYTKRFDDGTVVYVEEVRKGRKELALRTMYKRRSGSLLDEHLHEPSSHTSETASSSAATLSTGKGSETPPTEQEQTADGLSGIRSRWENAPKVVGDADEIVLPDGSRLKGRYVLVESGAASASHNAMEGFAKTEGFPTDEHGNTVNDRDYERDRDAQEVTRRIGARYDSRALQSPVVVSRDGVVLSGNGRTMAGELAARDNTDGEYNAYLREYPAKFGFTPAQVSAMAHPRVVFVPDTDLPYTTETFARFNRQEMKSQSKTEQAVKLGKIVDNATFARILQVIGGYDTLGEFYNDARAARGVMRQLVDAGVVDGKQLAELFDGNGLSVMGRDLLENVLIGKAFEGYPDAVRMLSAYRSMRQRVVTALGEISRNSALDKAYSLGAELAEAVRLCYEARNSGYASGERVSQHARQGNLFESGEGGTVSDYRNTTILMLADVLNDQRVTRLKKVMKLYNDSAQLSASGQSDLFGGSVRSKEDILNDVFKILDYGTKEGQQGTQTAGRRNTGTAGTGKDGPTGKGNPDGGGRGQGTDAESPRDGASPRENVAGKDTPTNTPVEQKPGESVFDVAERVAREAQAKKKTSNPSPQKPTPGQEQTGSNKEDTLTWNEAGESFQVDMKAYKEAESRGILANYRDFAIGLPATPHRRNIELAYAIARAGEDFNALRKELEDKGYKLYTPQWQALEDLQRDYFWGDITLPQLVDRLENLRSVPTTMTARQQDELPALIDTLAQATGLNGKLLSDIIKRNPSEKNINEFNQFETLKQSINTDKARRFLELLEGKEVKPRMVTPKMDKILREFILDPGSRKRIVNQYPGNETAQAHSSEQTGSNKEDTPSQGSLPEGSFQVDEKALMAATDMGIKVTLRDFAIGLPPTQRRINIGLAGAIASAGEDFNALRKSLESKGYKFDEQTWKALADLHRAFNDGDITLPQMVEMLDNATGVQPIQTKKKKEAAEPSSRPAPTVQPSPKQNSPKQEKGKEKGNATPTQRALAEALVEMLRQAGIQVVTDQAEMRKALNQGNAQLMAALESLQKAATFIRRALQGGRVQGSYTLDLPQATRTMIRRAMGRDFDSQNIRISTVRNGQNNQGTDDMKPLTEKDTELVPYIMLAPDYVRKGTDGYGRESIRFYKTLSNGYVVVVEKEQKNSPNDMDTISIWAESTSNVADVRSPYSNSGNNPGATSTPANTAQREAARGETNAVTVTISTDDAAKIRNDAQTAIAEDIISQQMTVYHGSPHLFQAFDHSHMGSGEGMQFHGWGTYVASDPKISEKYAMMDAAAGEKTGNHFYTVEIPDDNGQNYLDEEKTYTPEELEHIIASLRRVASTERTPKWKPAGDYTFREVEGIFHKIPVISVDDYLKHINPDVPALFWGQAYVDKRVENEFPIAVYFWNGVGSAYNTLLDLGISPYNLNGLSKKELKDKAERLLAGYKPYVQTYMSRYNQSYHLSEMDAVDKLETDMRGFVATGDRIYKTLSRWNSPKRASGLLHRAGFTGITYEGYRDGRCYVIFNENDLRITSHTQFLRTPSGEVYGFVQGGKVYLDPALLNTEAPVHEYTHLWDTALRRANPALWERGKELMKQLPLWEEVKNDPAYADIAHDEDLIASEVHARLSGKDGADLLRKMVEQAQKGGAFEVAEKAALAERFRRWLKEALAFVRNAFTGQWNDKELAGLTIEEFAAMPVRDLALGVNPDFMADYATSRLEVDDLLEETDKGKTTESSAPAKEQEQQDTPQATSSPGSLTDPQETVDPQELFSVQTIARELAKDEDVRAAFHAGNTPDMLNTILRNPVKGYILVTINNNTSLNL